LKVKKLIKGINKEMLIWVCGFIFLAFVDPDQERIFSFCPLHILGLDFCTGCGLGRSVAYIFKGEFGASFYTHPLGYFALFILTFRIIQLFIHSYKNIKNG
jgi:hypothetical protein